MTLASHCVNERLVVACAGTGTSSFDGSDGDADIVFVVVVVAGSIFSMIFLLLTFLKFRRCV